MYIQLPEWGKVMVDIFIYTVIFLAGFIYATYFVALGIRSLRHRTKRICLIFSFNGLKRKMNPKKALL